MTLVLSALTQDCVLQAIDRRLTNGVKGQVVSRDTNKAIFFAHAMLFGYTGPARIGGDTAKWIADTLASGHTDEECFGALVDGLNEQIARLSGARGPTPVAVDGVGWAVDRDTGAIGPRLIRVSNFIGSNGQQLGQVAPRVQVFDGMLKRHVLLNMRAAGQPVPVEIGRFWERTIKHGLKKSAPMDEIGKHLVGFIRQVARGNPLVGSGVLLSAVPRAAIQEPSGFVIAAMPMDREPTFKYFPEGSDFGIEKGPEVANPGGSRMSNFYAETMADGSQVVQVDMRMPPIP
jgi:hypothetical protein